MRADTQVSVPGAASVWHAEYLYRHAVVPGLTHEQYLDEPGESIQWLTRIHSLYQQEEARRNKE